MYRDEIKKIHDRLDKALIVDTTKEDDHLFQMSQSTGWEIFENKAYDLIAELLEPIIFEDNVSLEVRGSVNDARAFALGAVRKLIGNVQSIATAKKIQIIESTKVESE